MAFFDFFDDIFNFFEPAVEVVNDYLIDPIFSGGEDSIYNSLIKPIAGAGVRTLNTMNRSSSAPGYGGGQQRSSVRVSPISTRAMGRAGTPEGLRAVDPKDVHDEWDYRMRRFTRLTDLKVS